MKYLCIHEMDVFVWLYYSLNLLQWLEVMIESHLHHEWSSEILNTKIAITLTVTTPWSNKSGTYSLPCTTWEDFSLSALVFKKRAKVSTNCDVLIILISNHINLLGIFSNDYSASMSLKMGSNGSIHHQLQFHTSLYFANSSCGVLKENKVFQNEMTPNLALKICSVFTMNTWRYWVKCWRADFWCYRQIISILHVVW